MEVSDQLHAPAVLRQERVPPIPLDRRMSGPQKWCGHGGEEKKNVTSLPLTNETPLHFIQLVLSDLEVRMKLFTLMGHTPLT
jgi:hypothetical protein